MRFGTDASRRSGDLIGGLSPERIESLGCDQRTLDTWGRSKEFLKASTELGTDRRRVLLLNDEFGEDAVDQPYRVDRLCAGQIGQQHVAQGAPHLAVVQHPVGA